MRLFSKMGVTAIALSLSLSFLIPTRVFAAIPDNDRMVYAGVFELPTSDKYDSTLITKDIRRIAEFATEAEAENAYAAAGYTEAAGYSIETWTRGGKSLYVITYTVYKNEITGATSVRKTDVDPQQRTQTGFTKTVYIPKNEVTNLMVMVENGGLNINAVKSSNKKIFTAKLNKKIYQKCESNENADIDQDELGNYYYYSSTGNKIIIPKNADGTCNYDSVEYLNSNDSMAYLSIKLTPVKVGTANLKFNVVDRNGLLTPVTIKIIVREDEQPFKTFSYGGISLIQKRYGDSKYVDNGRLVGSNNNGFIAGGKGKLVVKANKGFKIVKIEVGKLSEKDFEGIRNWYDGVYQNFDNDQFSGSGSTTTTDCPIDLNGDGDFLDTVYGISENNPRNAFRFKRVKSGKTITLSKVAPYIDGSSTIISKTHRNKRGEQLYYKVKEGLRANLAPTVIRVTYFDSANREYKVVAKIIKTVAKRDDD